MKSEGRETARIVIFMEKSDFLLSRNHEKRNFFSLLTNEYKFCIKILRSLEVYIHNFLVYFFFWFHSPFFKTKNIVSCNARHCYVEVRENTEIRLTKQKTKMVKQEKKIVCNHENSTLWLYRPIFLTLTFIRSNGKFMM